uniref:(northern house mosquito) hypothetical protein n=1 Tax=Culex pipiens TaxID=7175 RepID=A0A8D8MY87_CULPI
MLVAITNRVVNNINTSIGAPGPRNHVQLRLGRGHRGRRGCRVGRCQHRVVLFLVLLGAGVNLDFTTVGRIGPVPPGLLPQLLSPSVKPGFQVVQVDATVVST